MDYLSLSHTLVCGVKASNFSIQLTSIGIGNNDYDDDEEEEEKDGDGDEDEENEKLKKGLNFNKPQNFHKNPGSA